MFFNSCGDADVIPQWPVQYKVVSQGAVLFEYVYQ